jgi:uncharacterized protein (DUF58 family)
MDSQDRKRELETSKLQSKSKARITPLLANDVLARVERLRLNPVARYTNRSRGEHISRAGGSSIEFKDYRDYSAGDDMRYIDWNIFSRLHRPYVKLFHEEEEMHVVLLIDASASMGFENKLERAKELAAALGVMGLLGTEKVSVQVFNHRDTTKLHRFRPHAGRVSMRSLFQFLEPIEAGGEAPLEEGVDMLLKHHSGRGIVVVLSDFLTTGDLRKSFNMLFSSGLEIFGLQVLSPTEIEPDVSQDLRLVDSETGETLDVTAGGDIVELYEEYRDAFQLHLESLAQSRRGRVLTVSCGDPIEHLIFDVLRRRGWIR